jgi:DNA repair protein RadC
MLSSSFSSLSNQSLLAIMLGGDIAQQLAGVPLNELFEVQASAESAVCDGEARYLAQPVVHAAKELLSRALRERLQCGEALASPQIVKAYLANRIGALPHEVFSVLLLDTQNRLIHYEELFRGTLQQTSVYPREVVKCALARNAASAVFAHNHPSGATEPSQADELLTQTLKQALSLVGVKVLDHIIVAGGASMSFAERGLL